MSHLWRCPANPQSWGGTDLERGYGDMQPWRPPFHAPPVVQKSEVHKTPFWEKKMKILASTTSIFAPILALKPQIWKFQFTRPLFQRQNQFTSPTLRKSGPHIPTWKKVECPPCAFSEILLRVFKQYRQIFTVWTDEISKKINKINTK